MTEAAKLEVSAATERFEHLLPVGVGTEAQ